MGNFGQWISFGMLLNLNQRYNQGQNINKNELHTAIESCKQLFSKMADAAKDYIEQRLRDENKLNE